MQAVAGRKLGVVDHQFVADRFSFFDAAKGEQRITQGESQRWIQRIDHDRPFHQGHCIGRPADIGSEPVGIP